MPLGQVSLATRGPSSEEAVQAAGGPRGNISVHRGLIGSKQMPDSFPRAATTTRALLSDGVFAFGLKSPPPSNLQQFGSAQCDQELGSSQEGGGLA